MKYPPNYLLIQQNTPEWLIERTGAITASRMKDLMAKLKSGKESAARSSYRLELLTESLTGRAAEHYVSAAMDFGTENEPLARAHYEFSKGIDVEKIGYIRHPSIPRSGCSPDGLVGDAGLVEIKCPTTASHLQYLLDDVVPEDYKPQMTWQLACSGRQWCDFVSYDPRLPSEYSLFVVRFDRDEDAIAEMEKEVILFISELNAMAKQLLKHSAAVRSGPAPPKAEMPTFK